MKKKEIPAWVKYQAKELERELNDALFKKIKAKIDKDFENESKHNITI